MALIEGTSQGGEGNNVEDTDFYKWMISAQAKLKLIVKLIDCGIDSIDMLEEVANDESILDDTDLNKIEKAKVRTILKNLPNRHNIIAQEESDAVVQMENKLKKLKTAINLVSDTKQSIDEEVTNHTKSIQSTFKDMHQLLHQRETALIEELNEIATKKKNDLDNISKTLHQQTQTSQQQISTCHRSLKQSIELSELEQRKKQILNIAKTINDIKVITKEDPIIVNNEINIDSIELDAQLFAKHINVFGAVFGGVLPVLISLDDNKDCSIGMKWKLNRTEYKANDVECKLKVEWSDIESKNDDLDTEMKEEWKYNKVYSLQTEQYWTINVRVENKTTVYAFRIQYFNGKSWSNHSNIKSIAFKAITMDKWDPNAIGSYFTMNGNTIIKTQGGQYQSAYLSNVVCEGIHIWKIKYYCLGNNWTPFGIWKTESGQPILNSYFTSQTRNGYGYVLANKCTTNPEKPGHPGTTYAVECKSGDTVTMIVNFNTLSLSYKVNAIEYGKAFDIERTTYRAAISCNNAENNVTLLSYHGQ